MKKIYFVGDVKNNTGPAIVNKSYKKYLSNKIIFCNSNNKIYRTLHFLIHISQTKIIIISGFSKLNYMFLKFAKKLNKKTCYLMHGCIQIESKYNKNIKDESKLIEKNILKEADKIICVSKMFAEVIKKEFPKEKTKVTYINNGIEKTNCTKNKRKNKETYQIISVGGGSKQKNNLEICKAINEIEEKKIKFIVIGKLSECGDDIKKYPFVEYFEELSHKDVLKKMEQSDLYIQNSYFETFGLAILEALSSGCNILISRNIGVIDLLENVSENDIIYNNESINEIKDKIINKIKQKNNYIKIKEKSCWEHSSQRLLDEIWK